MPPRQKKIAQNKRIARQNLIKKKERKQQRQQKIRQQQLELRKKQKQSRSRQKQRLNKTKNIPKTKKTPKKRNQKEYDTNKWITITFLKDPIHSFFPSNIFPEAINSQRMNYSDAKGKTTEFWKDKKIVFHMADRNREEWLPFYKKVIDSSKIAWIKYAAKSFMTFPEELDRRRYKTPMSFYRILDESCNNVLWELPPNYGGFWNDKNKVPLTLYDSSYEVPIKEKKIDFLAVIDKYFGSNCIKTLELMRKLSQAGYKVKCILIQSKKNNLRKYNKKRIGIDTIINNKNPTGQKIFYDLCQDSKIMVDLSYRWTLGRVVYEALFNGALAICTNTYGASHHLFPDLIVDAANFNMQDTYKKCVDVVEKWSPKVVRQYRQRAQQYASPEVFSNKLNKETNKILGL